MASVYTLYTTVSRMFIGTWSLIASLVTCATQHLSRDTGDRTHWFSNAFRAPVVFLSRTFAAFCSALTAFAFYALHGASRIAVLVRLNTLHTTVARAFRIDALPRLHREGQFLPVVLPTV